MNSLFSELIGNIKISFIEKEKNIKYEEYYFNGIQIPKNIEFQEIGSTSFKIIWKIDDINNFYIKNIFIFSKYFL